jgi:hypothetical protein
MAQGGRALHADEVRRQAFVDEQVASLAAASSRGEGAVSPLSTTRRPL